MEMVLSEMLYIGLLTVAFVAVFCSLGACFWLWKRLTKNEMALQKMERQAQTAILGAQGMGHRILALEAKINILLEKQENIAGTDVFAYSQAKQLFEKGADASTVAISCGLSNSEAQLMALVQKQMKNNAQKPTKQKLEIVI
jgi:Protein of unknown function (DUF2802)